MTLSNSVWKRLRAVSFLTCVLLGAICCAGLAQAEHPGQAAFIERSQVEHGLDEQHVRDVLAEAKYQQSIIDAITRPAEGKPWHEYRRIFLTEDRIQQGVDFWAKHEDLIRRAAEVSQVDEQIIVAIIGVETKYGRITGSYRVIDALATLGFYYPKRAKFFANELMEFIKLADEEQLPITEITGSYAGAMGLGQFIPSSYRAYSVDFDGDGSRDLWGSAADAIGSVANYFHEHRWKKGGLVALKALPATTEKTTESMNVKPESTLAALQEMGFGESIDLESDTPASLRWYAQEDGHDAWLTFHNFYVITRYNRSPLYAMAVLQLSQEIEAARKAEIE